MKTLIIMAFSMLFFSQLNAKVQGGEIKKDTIYYLLDTSAVPIKDRMFTMERESRYMVYGLTCRCNPYATSIPFFYDFYLKKQEKISKEKFKKIETVSITRLIDIALKCLDPVEKKKYVFIFIEPDGVNMKLTRMLLGAPYNPREITDSITIKSDQ